MSFAYIIRDSDGRDRDFESLYAENFQNVFQYLVHCVGSVSDAEDLTAQVFFKAMRNLWRYRWNRGSFKSWLFRIAHNEMKSYYRKKGRHEKLWDQVESLDGIAKSGNEIMEAENERQKDRFYVFLQKRIAELPPEENSLLVMRFFQNKTFEELGEIFKVRKGTLAMRIHRSLKKLKKHLDMEGLDHEEFRRSFESLSQA